MPSSRGGLPRGQDIGPTGADSVAPEGGIGLSTVWQPNLSGHLSRLLVISNPMSGWKGAGDAFAKHVSETLDKSGVVHKTRNCPPDMLQKILDEERKASPSYDSVLLAGGDGTINSYVTALLEKENAYWREKPIAVLPCGLNNGFSCSLGITNSAVTTASLISNRTRPVPIFVATVDGKRLCAFVGAMHIGVFADVICTSRKMKEYCMGFVALPPPVKTNLLATLYHLFAVSDAKWKAKNIEGAFRWRDPKTKSIEAVGDGFAMLSVSQTVYHHHRYSLTPHAFLGQPFFGPKHFAGDLKPRLAITSVSKAASRSRLLHLLLKEGPTGAVEDEDGVRMFDAEAIELCMERGSSSSSSNSGSSGDDASRASATISSAVGKTRTLLLDGEQVELEPGQSFKISPSNLALHFMIP